MGTMKKTTLEWKKLKKGFLSFDMIFAGSYIHKGILKFFFFVGTSVNHTFLVLWVFLCWKSDYHIEIAWKWVEGDLDFRLFYWVFFGNHLIREYKYIGMNSRDRAIYRFRVMTFFVAGFRSLILRDRNKWLGVL